MFPISKTVDADGPVHVLDFGGRGEPIVLVHGLGGSTANWLGVGARLAELGRTIAIDLAGFGRTAPRGRPATVGANRDLLHSVLEKVVGEPAVVVGNSMGGMISVMEAAAAPNRVSRLVLVAPAQPAPPGTRIDREVFAAFALYSLPWAGAWYMRRRAARLGPEGLVREMLRLCCADPSRVDPALRQAHVDAVRERMQGMPWANGAFLEAARSTLASIRRRRRWDAMVASIAAPTLLIQGTHDRLVPLAASRTLSQRRPDWAFEIYEGVGHVPQIETPERFADSLARWLSGVRGQGARRG